MEEEYELIPMSPIRRLEKRMDKVERSGSATDIVKELIEFVRTNQHVVDDIVKINSELMTRVSDLSGSVKELTNKVNDFMGRLEASGSPGEEGGGDVESRMDDKLNKMEKKINSLVLGSLARRAPMPAPAQRRELLFKR